MRQHLYIKESAKFLNYSSRNTTDSSQSGFETLTLSWSLLKFNVVLNVVCLISERRLPSEL